MDKVVFVVPPQVHLLDLAGPAQVFSSLVPSPELVYVGETSVVNSHQYLPVTVATQWPELSTRDILIVPGFEINQQKYQCPFHPTTVEKIAAHHLNGGEVASICAGAIVLAEAGILHGRRATTHHAVQELFARRYPRIQVVRDVLYTEDHGVYTSAGIASGIDLSLYLVEKRYGAKIAAQIARTMVVYIRRNGEATQHSVMLRFRDHVNDDVHRIQNLIEERFAENLTLKMLAEELAMSERTLSRLFVRNTGITPWKYQQLLRQEHAELLIANGASRDAAARQVGFSDARTLRRLRKRLEP